MDGGSTSAESKTTASPWKPTKPYLEDILQSATDLYQGRQPQQFRGRLAPQLSGYTRNFMDLAQQGVGYNPLEAQARSTLGAVAAGVPRDPTQAFTQDIMYGGGGVNPAMPFAFADRAAAGAPNPAMEMMYGTASGEMLGANPYLEAQYGRAARPMVEAFQEATTPGLASIFSMAGRGGSPAHAREYGRAADVLGQNLQELGVGLYGGAYGQERALQEAARSNIGSLHSQGLRDQFAATGQLGQLGSTELAQRMQAAGLAQQGYGQDVGRQLQAAGMVPEMEMSQLAQMGQLQSAGRTQDAINATRLMERMRRHEQRQLGQYSPFGSLDRYASTVLPISGLGGTTISQQPLYQPSPFENILAAGTGGLGMAAGLGWQPFA